ncbi:ZIP family metal transporter [Novosphingopyxis sp.]|uniref:ZIP family metal transporter n=1 Tax=Novosphingopyxis sp. TaxID=2709690 RepID=UPI003B5A84B8
MLTLIVTVVVVSAALLIGAAWGIYGSLHAHLEGFLIALAGGALIVSVVAELIQPAIQRSTLPVVFLSVAAGAGIYSLCDWWIDKKIGEDSGGGLLAAITLDGIPENIALGIALIGAGFMQIAALAGAIFLSNLPEAAGGAKEMAADGHGKGKVLGLWALTALLLSVAAIVGNLALSHVSKHLLAAMQGFAAGAVVASLATAVFPKAFKEDNYWTGIAVAIGLVLALALGELGG